MYFITIAAAKQACLFGNVSSGEFVLSSLGEAVREEWLRTAVLRPMVALDVFVVMPNHFLGIIAITDSGRTAMGRGTALCSAPAVERFGRLLPDSIPTIIRSFKSAVTRRINEILKTPGNPVWQRNYYEHVIRDEDDLNNIRQYICTNPLQWDIDRENPSANVLKKTAPWQI